MQNALIQSLLAEIQCKVKQLDDLINAPKLWASTGEVSNFTKEKYDWKPLKDYCVQNNLEIMKVKFQKEYYNVYPNQAWINVYNINLSQFKS